MKKRVIKIIKRDTVGIRLPSIPTAEEILERHQKDVASEKRDMTTAVKSWISERRENSKAEAIYSNGQLFDWDIDGSAESVGRTS